MVNCGDCGNENFEKASGNVQLKFKLHPPVELYNSFNPRDMLVNLNIEVEYCPCGKIFLRDWQVVKREFVNTAENMRQMINELA